ncbi:GNAT family protein [Actinoplanes sp. Pm04-4]|uniref:GNAT family protein n=1 Tax=Paractinoplanes pyxinae TaxID=2997416 RepID=A0ABT4AYP3_9ACTN|nr:GNAT family protein [Actinoplanes pyxinae]MCY1139368.1 GNAT family protein [Actinoplanes pyxinae]
MSNYPPLNLRVRTPRVTLEAATDELLERLVPVVRAGLVVDGQPLPFDDPMTLYDESPQREWGWMRRVWAGRSRVSAEFWRLYFVVCEDGEPLGMQDLIGRDFAALGTVTTFSWLAPGARGRGLGKEARAAILQLAFDGFGAREAGSEAFADNKASNGVSAALGYSRNGTAWATRRGEPAQLLGWRLTRDDWAPRRRADIELSGVEECRPVLGL